jgi:hypothetical protein
LRRFPASIVSNWVGCIPPTASDSRLESGWMLSPRYWNNSAIRQQMLRSTNHNLTPLNHIKQSLYYRLLEGIKAFGCVFVYMESPSASSDQHSHNVYRGNRETQVPPTTANNSGYFFQLGLSRDMDKIKMPGNAHNLPQPQ